MYPVVSYNIDPEDMGIYKVSTFLDCPSTDISLTYCPHVHMPEQDVRWIMVRYTPGHLIVADRFSDVVFRVIQGIAGKYRCMVVRERDVLTVSQ